MANHDFSAFPPPHPNQEPGLTSTAAPSYTLCPQPHDSHSSEVIVHRPPQSKALDGFGNWSNYGNFTLKTGSCGFPIEDHPPHPGPPASQRSGTMKVAPFPLSQNAKWLVWKEGFSIEGISHPLSSLRRGQGAAEWACQESFFVSTTLAVVPVTCKAQQWTLACSPSRLENQDRRPPLPPPAVYGRSPL